MPPHTPQEIRRRMQLVLVVSSAFPLLFFFLILNFDRPNLFSVGALTSAVSIPVLQSLIFAGSLDDFRSDFRNDEGWSFNTRLLAALCAITTTLTMLARPSLPWGTGLFCGYIVWGFAVDLVFDLPYFVSFMFCLQSLAFTLFHLLFFQSARQRIGPLMASTVEQLDLAT